MPAAEAAWHHKFRLPVNVIMKLVLQRDSASCVTKSHTALGGEEQGSCHDVVGRVRMGDLAFLADADTLLAGNVHDGSPGHDSFFPSS